MLVEGSPGDYYVRKPRVLTWEYLILDKYSPFRVKMRGIPENNFDKYLGHVKYFTSDEGTPNLAEFICNSAQSQTLNDIYLDNLGRLLAFCTIFGIIDLHKNNCIKLENHLQLIDIECIFFDAESSADTLLINNRKSLFENSILGEIPAKSSFENLENNLITLLNGFWSEFEFFLDNEKMIQFELLKLESDLKHTPIRILLRDTKEYRSREYSSSLIEEELAQIERLDIPYFFGYLDRKEIYYFTKENIIRPVLVDNLKFIQRKIDRSFKRFDYLLHKDRFLKILKQSIMIIAARFYPYIKSNKIIGNSFIMTINNGYCTLESSLFTCKANLITRK